MQIMMKSNQGKCQNSQAKYSDTLQWQGAPDFLKQIAVSYDDSWH